MASFSNIFLAALIVMFSSQRALAQAPTAGCSNTLTSLSPCLSYMTSNATTSPPPAACCNALSSVVKTSVSCLCTLFSSNNALGFPINQTRAVALPGACKITAPPLSNCNATATSPATSPATTPTSAPMPSTPKNAAAPAPTTGVSTPKDISPSPSTTTTTTTGVEGPTASTSSGHLQFVANKLSLVGVVGVAVSVMAVLA